MEPWRRARHLDVLSSWLGDAGFGKRRRILVLMPPRHGKSQLISYWFPVWYLNHWPERRILLASYEADFAAQWGRKVRNTIAGNQALLRTRIAGDSAAANRWETTAGGGMGTAGVGGPMTGKGAEVLIIDDPFKNSDEAQSATYRDRLWDWWTSTAYTRLEPNGVVVITMTRWHEDDLVGRLLTQAKAGGEPWDVLCAPALAEEHDQLGRAIEEPLWPDRYGRAELAQKKLSVGSYVWNALYQQHPSPAEGGMFKRTWWRFYTSVPGKLDEVIQSWDCAFKGTNTSDFVVGQVWGRKGGEYFLLDQVRARLDFPATCAAIENLSLKWPNATKKLIEDKANGPAVISSLGKRISGLVPVEPEGNKESRAAAVTPFVEAGNVHLPLASVAPWVDEFLEELAAFPNGAHDDQVDAATQALSRLGLTTRPVPFNPMPAKYRWFRRI